MKYLVALYFSVVKCKVYFKLEKRIVNLWPFSVLKKVHLF